MGPLKLHSRKLRVQISGKHLDSLALIKNVIYWKYCVYEEVRKWIDDCIASIPILSLFRRDIALLPQGRKKVEENVVPIFRFQVKN